MEQRNIYIICDIFLILDIQILAHVVNIYLIEVACSWFNYHGPDIQSVVHIEFIYKRLTYGKNEWNIKSITMTS